MKSLATFLDFYIDQFPFKLQNLPPNQMQFVFDKYSTLEDEGEQAVAGCRKFAGSLLACWSS